MMKWKRTLQCPYTTRFVMENVMENSMLSLNHHQRKEVETARETHRGDIWTEKERKSKQVRKKEMKITIEIEIEREKEREREREREGEKK